MIEGIDSERVERWLAEHLAGFEAPFVYERIGGGRSNLTFAVTDVAGRRFVLRRPPLGHVLATAHDMRREHRVITAMGPTAVPVPETLALCTDDSVNGAPFYVMTLVDGEVLDSAEAAAPIGPALRMSMAEHLIEVLVSLHDLDIDDIGLGDLGRREGYLARQLSRWSRQWEGSKTRDLPVVDAVAEQLAKRIPGQQGVGVVHGDFRFGNCITDVLTGRVNAVLDWELCTLGDPLADLGYLGVFWADNDGTGGGVNDPSTAGGFGTFAEAVERYASQSKRDLTDINYYVAFQLWRSAVIMEGVYARYLHGAMGEQPIGDDMAYLEQAPVELSERARLALVHLG